MATTTYTVKIDTDYSALGEDATQELLDGYARNLATKLALDFSVDIEVEQALGARGQCVGPDDDLAARISEAVRDIQGGDDWVDLLPVQNMATTTMTTRIILDNGGGITLQLGAWAHSYEGSDNASIAKQAARDIREWLTSGTTRRWEGHDADALAIEPTSDEIRNGGYRVITIDRESDTAASLADEVRWGAMGDAVGDALAPATNSGEDAVTVHLDSPNGPKAHYLGSLDVGEVLAALPAGWTVHEDAWQSAVKIDDLTWSVPLTKIG